MRGISNEVVARVFQDVGGTPETAIYRGEHRFLVLPSIDERIIIGAGFAPWNDVLLVVSVEHRPVQVPTPSTARSDSTVTIYANKIGEEA